MSRAAPSKNALLAVTHNCKSSFTLTFAVEIFGADIWHDCVEERVELGPYQQALKLQYQLYPGQLFELDVLIWPHVAKIWCGNRYAYVRTWRFLEERWLTFSIRHAFPVKVHNMLKHVATVTCTMGPSSLGANAKNDKSFEVFLPPLKFGERRYFGPVLETEETNEQYLVDLLWSLVVNYIPASHLDGIIDTPYNTTDLRHQDAILSKVQESILSKSMVIDKDEILVESEEVLKSRMKVQSKMSNEKAKKIVEIQKEKFAITLSGDALLAGLGRITAFDIIGERPADQNQVTILISSNNLPAENDHPIIFINVETLNDIPIQELKKSRISQVFTQWKIGNEEHKSLKQIIKLVRTVKINDHHTVPLPFSEASEIVASLLENPFEIQLRGVRQLKLTYQPVLFGNHKNDHNFGISSPTKANTRSYEEEVVISVTKIDASSLAKETNGIVRGEFPLYPLEVSLSDREREDSCSNDINGIKQTIKPDVVIQRSVILESQMTLEVSIGVVGCRPHSINHSYLRLFCCTSDPGTTSFLQKILEINENLIATNNINELLTGFALDTIDAVILYVEGQRNGPILTFLEFTANCNAHVNSLFSSSDHHIERIYPEMLLSTTPFSVLKMLVPGNTLLACPHIYVKPSLPLPTRSALLKLGRLIASEFKISPNKGELPTNEELKSFRLELCIPPRPPREAAAII